MKDFFKKLFGSLLRHGLTAAGGGGIVAGSVTNDPADIAAGAIVTLAGVALSVVKNQKENKK